jgi:hypothetical protein
MKPPATIELRRFATLLEIHGADPARFPDAERAPVLALLASSPEARTLLADAEALARTLNGLRDPEPSASLLRAVAEIPLRHPRAATAWPLTVRWLWRAGLSAAFIVVLGALSGAWSAETVSEDEWSDMASLAFVTELDQELAP